MTTSSEDQLFDILRRCPPIEAVKIRNRLWALYWIDDGNIDEIINAELKPHGWTIDSLNTYIAINGPITS